MFAYARAAIDSWPGWLTETEFEDHLSERYFSPPDVANAWAAYGAFRNQAFELAKKVGWEGDVGSGPYVAGLPTHDTGSDGFFIVAWKQGNNGDTFVVSPYKLPWLEEDDYGKWVEG